MNEKRKAEIALALLRAKAMDDGWRIIPSVIKQELGDLAYKTGIPKEELKVFLKEEAERILKIALE